MSLESDLRTYLLAQGPINSAVDTRIYPNRLPDEPVAPAIVYQRITTSHDKASGNVPLVRVRVQLDIYDDRYETVSSIAEAIHTALDFASASGIHAALPEDDDDFYDAEAQLHRRRIDMFIWRQQ